MRTRGFGVDMCQKLINKLNALEKGKRVMETVPNLEATSRAFIRKPNEEISAGLSEFNGEQLRRIEIRVRRKQGN